MTGKVKDILSPLPLVLPELLGVPLVFFIATTFCAMGDDFRLFSCAPVYAAVHKMQGERQDDRVTGRPFLSDVWNRLAAGMPYGL
jgi:hypothetical protein